MKNPRKTFEPIVEVTKKDVAQEDPKVLAGAVRLGEIDHVEIQDDVVVPPIASTIGGSCSILDHSPADLWKDWPQLAL